ncbi:MAG TPA: hypothetical protein VG498_07510 [Terriglobales bacterium]|nr:hypothetical protein [Terriglobales bacterium]
MRSKMALPIAALMLIPSAWAQSVSGSEISAFLGTWEGEKINGLPSIDLQIESAGKELHGTAIFYLQTRKDANQQWQASDETHLPMLSAVVQGNSLSFEVRHHRCHDCLDYGPNVKFRMQVTQQNEAHLWKATGEQMHVGEGLNLVRKR